MVGAVQVVGHGWILCCQGVDLRWDRTVILRSVCSLRKHQLLTRSPVWPRAWCHDSASALCLPSRWSPKSDRSDGQRSRPVWPSAAAPLVSGYCRETQSEVDITEHNCHSNHSKRRTFVIYKALESLVPSLYHSGCWFTMINISGLRFCQWLFFHSVLCFSDWGISIITADNG